MSFKNLPHYSDCVCQLKDILDYDTDFIVEGMKRYHVINSGIEPNQSNINAWKDEINSLKAIVASLRRTNKTYLDLHIVFEYKMPKYQYDESFIFADVIIVSNNKIALVEFKQRDHTIGKMFAAEVAKYRNRLRKHHLKSKDKQIKAFMVLTKEDDECFYEPICTKFNGIKCKYIQVSPPVFPYELFEWFKDSEPIDDITEWVKSYWLF